MNHFLNVDANGYFAERSSARLSPEVKWKSALRRMAQVCFASEIAAMNSGVASNVNTEVRTSFENNLGTGPKVNGL